MLRGLPAVLRRMGVRHCDFAAEVGVTPRTISRWAKGDWHPRAGNLVAVMAALRRREAGIALEDLDPTHRHAI